MVLGLLVLEPVETFMVVTVDAGVILMTLTSNRLQSPDPQVLGGRRPSSSSADVFVELRCTVSSVQFKFIVKMLYEDVSLSLHLVKDTPFLLQMCRCKYVAAT